MAVTRARSMSRSFSPPLFALALDIHLMAHFKTIGPKRTQAKVPATIKADLCGAG